MMRVQHLRVANDHAPLDGIFELADVPASDSTSHVDRRRSDPLHVLAVLARELVEKVIGQLQNVSFPLRSGGTNREDVEAVVEVFAEC